MKRITALMCVALTAGCTSIEAEPGSENVVLLGNPALISGCRFIRQETVTVRAYENFGENMEGDIRTRMKNVAASANGTHVLTQGGPQIMGRINAMTMTGDIYRC